MLCARCRASAAMRVKYGATKAHASLLPALGRVCVPYCQCSISEAKVHNTLLALLRSCIPGPISRLIAKRREGRNEEREADVSPTVLVFRSAELERVRRTIQHVREHFPDHQIALALSDTEKDYFGGWPGVSRFYYYRAHRGVVKGSLDLLRA